MTIPLYRTPDGQHPAYDPLNPRRLIQAYGCLRCQCEHVEHQPDGLFGDHLTALGKLGVYGRLPNDGEAFRRLVEEGE
jgi:hypothetical protein